MINYALENEKKVFFCKYNFSSYIHSFFIEYSFHFQSIANIFSTKWLVIQSLQNDLVSVWHFAFILFNLGLLLCYYYYLINNIHPFIWKKKHQKIIGKITLNILPYNWFQYHIDFSKCQISYCVLSLCYSMPVIKT